MHVEKYYDQNLLQNLNVPDEVDVAVTEYKWLFGGSRGLVTISPDVAISELLEWLLDQEIPSLLVCLPQLFGLFWRSAAQQNMHYQHTLKTVVDTCCPVQTK